ncbi:MAG: ROK family protein [Opitutaceae bacterium]|nr:ROK family protein [Opitutaceae bacterium]
MIIDLHGPRCLTGPQGTGESLASVTALVQLVRDHVARGLATSLSKMPTDEILFPNIVAAVRRRDPVIRELFERWLDRFTAVLLNAYYAYTPDLILLAGGPTQAADVFLQKLQARLNASAFRVPVGYRIPVRIAKLGEDAGWVGAALHARDKFDPEQSA